MTDAQCPLAQDFGAALPRAVAELPAEQRATLSAAFRGVRAEHLASLDNAVSEAIEHLPPMLRSQARKALAQ